VARRPERSTLFFSGCLFGHSGLSATEFDPENPGYAAWQHYSEPLAWADASLKRLKGWGFTTLGAWSDHETLKRSTEMTLWLTPVLHVGSTAGAPGGYVGSEGGSADG